MKSKLIISIILIITLVSLLGLVLYSRPDAKGEKVNSQKDSYWFLLHRKSSIEYLYFGIPGDKNGSKVVRKFQVKTGASWSPTPLPELVNRKFWKIVKKESSLDNPETAPYFLQLDVPATEDWPYGPVPYTECLDLEGNNIQCDWILPGYFGLHGTGGNPEKLSNENYGSSGCIRHLDEDITFLYDLLDPEKEEIRYYIKDI